MTPAPVPTDTATTESPLPPGVSGSGDVDPGVLATAHLAALDGRSYVRRADRSFGDRTSNATLRVESPTRYRYERADRLGLTNASEFADRTHLYSRFVQFSTRFTYGEVDDAQSRHGSSAARSIQRYLNLSNASVAETRVDGKIHVGSVEGWIANWGSPLVVRDRGDGQVCGCTFRVTDRYGEHPTATALVDRLLREL